MAKQRIVGSLMLLLTAFIWGSAFVAQSTGMQYVDPFSFNCVRFFLGSIVLIPFIALKDMKKKRSPDYVKPSRAERLHLVKVSIASGLVLGSAALVQQCGIMYTTVGKAGFITALYVVIVPIMGVFFHKHPDKRLWLCVAVSVLGLGLLTLSDISNINKGDIMALCAAFLFAAQIVIIERKAGDLDGIKLSSIQYAAAGVLSGVLMLLLGSPSVDALLAAKTEILYTGVLSCGVAYTFQILGQQRLETTVASMIMSLECVFSALMGSVILHQHLSCRELIGSGLMFIAIISAQLFLNEKVNDNDEKRA